MVSKAQLEDPNANRSLTGKQRRFVEAYCGEAGCNAVKAAKMAGYGGDENSLRVIGSNNLTKVNIRKAIEEERRKHFDPATVEEVLQYFTNTMRDENLEPRDRTKAAENLAKTLAMFVERHQVEANVDAKVNNNTLREIIEDENSFDKIQQLQDEIIDGILSGEKNN